jgi:hypothetical protein
MISYKRITNTSLFESVEALTEIVDEEVMRLEEVMRQLFCQNRNKKPTLNTIIT